MKLVESLKPKQRAATPESVRLVVVEEGALGFESRVPPDEGEETIVVAQTSGELPANLVIRVATRIAAIERSRRTIGRAILLVGSRQDAQVAASRWLIARSLLSHLLLAGGSELVLDAEGAEANVRYELLSLVDGLLEKLEQGSVPIRLQFRKDPPPAARPSGVYAAPGAVQESHGKTGNVRFVS